MKGSVGVLNVGAGDTKLSFDPKNPAERIRAARIVRDMLRRGYALLVEIERDGQKVFTRAHDFDESVCEYIIADFDSLEAKKADAVEEENRDQKEQAGQGQTSAGEATAKPQQRAGKRRVKAEDTRAVAVSASAGG